MKWFAIVGLVVQSTILIAIILFLAIWISVSLSEYCCFCFRRSRLRPPWAVAGAGSSSTSSRGLKPTEIERFPTFVYPKVQDSASVKMSRGITECAVCLGAFKEAETLRLIPLCGHVFHADCVDVWLRSHYTCPCCRANLQVLPPETSQEESPV